MLKLSNVTVEYKKNSRRVVPLKGVDFELGASEFVTVTGRSGSGKTTFVQVCGGLLSPTTGSVWIKDVDVGNMKDDRISEIRNRSIGFVFQFFNLIEYLTALENVALPLVFAGMDIKTRNEKAMSALRSMHLDDRANHYPSELSGGECQRVAISRALVTDPDIIIADEPTGNLDYETSRQVMDIFSSIHLTKQRAILMVTHNPWVADFGTRKVGIQEGQLIDHL